MQYFLWLLILWMVVKMLSIEKKILFVFYLECTIFGCKGVW